MRPRIRFCLPVLLAVCLSAGDAPDPNANAALDFWRAIHFLGEDKERIGRLGEGDVLKAQLPDPAADAAFAQPLRVLNLLALGAASPYCDWGIDGRGEGADALLPHLQPMRRLGRLVLLRARWQSAQGRQAEAADDLLLAMRTARLLGGRTPLLMDTLVGYSIETQAIAVAGALLPALDAMGRQRLEVGLAALPASATVADALSAEAASVQWIVDRLLAQPPVKRPAFFAALGGGGSGLDALRLLPEVTDEKLRALPGLYAVELARWQAHLRKPIAERFPLPEIWSGGKAPNALLDVVAPAFPGMARSELQLLQRRQMLQAAVARLATGEAGMAAVLDPLSGKPFVCAPRPGGFRLSAAPASDAKPVELEVGTAPAPAEGKAPADF
jgi:hypothetical protein